MVIRHRAWSLIRLQSWTFFKPQRFWQYDCSSVSDSQYCLHLPTRHLMFHCFSGRPFQSNLSRIYLRKSLFRANFYAQLSDTGQAARPLWDFSEGVGLKQLAWGCDCSFKQIVPLFWELCLGPCLVFNGKDDCCEVIGEIQMRFSTKRRFQLLVFHHVLAHNLHFKRDSLMCHLNPFGF